MLNAIYEENCSNCKGDLECHFCRETLCEKCMIQAEGKHCCRPCSASIRNDKALVAYFVEWHRTANLGAITLLKPPILVVSEFKKGSLFSVAEFENENIIGSITLRSDGQSDAEAMDIDSGKALFTEYRILVNEREIEEFLTSLYASV
ncbi:hypothetical protein [Leucothrix arctica]|uniref:Uncharacterized protein n=1 Tax=Leucothrix arctica TaxID=1481894 RepID=A0A317CAW0_9GAMM|nr:hypothetical protein [Leucothrix arctica]PWQ95666.1 hypothetical protein DKT75_11570 [Leucothrix arctica]